MYLLTLSPIAIGDNSENITGGGGFSSLLAKSEQLRQGLVESNDRQNLDITTYFVFNVSVCVLWYFIIIFG